MNIKAYFNELIEDEDDLGDILFDGDSDDFEMRLAEMQPEAKKKYTNAIHQEVIEVKE